MKVTDSGEFEQVAAILDRISKEFVQVRAATQNIYRTEEETYDNTRGTMKDTLKELNRKLDEVNAKLEDYGSQKDNAEKAIGDAQTAINQADQDRTTELKRRAKAKETFDESQKNIDAAIVACGQVLGLLDEVLKKGEEVQGLSLLQTEKQKIQGRLEHIQEKVAKIRTKDPISPFLSSLLEVAQGDLNADVVEQVINMVKELKYSLESEKQDSISADGEDEKNSKGTIDNLDNTIGTQKVKLATNQESLTEINKNIENYKAQADAHTESIETAQEALDKLDGDWQKRSADLQAQIARLEQDIKSLGEASDYLTTQSIQ